MGIQPYQGLDIWLQTPFDIKSYGPIIVPSAADFTTANVQDNQLYNPMTASSSLITEETCFMIGDSGYDNQKLYDLSINRGFELVCPVQRYEHTSTKRLHLYRIL